VSGTQRAAFLLVLGLAVLMTACEDSAEPFVPPSFDRADQVAFACLDVVRGEGVPLGECEQASADLHLLALVTQSQRGELAVVDLAAEAIIDVNPQVPGFTFHPVGELPTGVAVAPDGTRGYVACSGGRSLSVFDIGTIARPEGRLDPIDLGGRAPFDVVASDDRLFVTVPDEGLLLAIDPESGDLTELPLAAEGSGGGGDPDAGAGDAGAEDAGAEDAGAEDAGASDAGTGEGDGGPPDDEAASRPWRMALDLEDRRLYVANAGRSAISVVDVDAVTELPGLATGASTTTLAVSPRRAEGEGDRWLYAVERNGGGVRVLNLATGELVDANRGSYERDGETIEYDDPKNAGPSIRVPGLARAVEFFSRGSEGDPAPEVLDGLFAAILSSDGLLYVVDVEDDDREAREADLDEVGYVFVPHHLRSLRRLTAAGLPQLSGNPTVEVSSTQVICGADYGFVGHFDGPGAPSCDDAGAGVEVQSDYPWQAIDETWTVTYEGTIPGTVRPRGNLEGDREVLDRAAGFCALGVQPGDRFVLVTPPAPADADADCGDDGDGELSWPIAEVFQDRLVLAEPFGLDPAQCGLDAFVDYRVRTNDAWTVVGTTSSFLHPVVVGEAGRCEPDPDADERLVGRARECDPDAAGECLYGNATLSFTMVRGVGEDGQPIGTEIDTAWTFTTINALAPLAISVGSLPSTVRYLPLRDSLVVIDPVEGGLVEVSVSSLSRERSYR
jgi:hypothetical protein